MKIFLIDHNQVLGDIKKDFDIVDKIEDADVVILWNDVLPIERAIINLARSLGKKTIVIQHGRWGTSRYYPPFNEKIQADKLLVWGVFDRRALIEAGQNPKKIEVVGTTVFSHLKSRVKHKGTNVVFFPEHWDKPVVENSQVRDELRKLKGISILTKLIDSPSHEKKLYDNVIYSDRSNDNHLDVCADVLSIADVVVGISESTFGLLAAYLDIPVIIMEEWTPKAFGGDMRYTEGYRRIISPAAKRATLKRLCDTIKHQLKNPAELKEERKQVCIDEGGLGLDTISLIKKVVG